MTAYQVAQESDSKPRITLCNSEGDHAPFFGYGGYCGYEEADEYHYSPSSRRIARLIWTTLFGLPSMRARVSDLPESARLIPIRTKALHSVLGLVPNGIPPRWANPQTAAYA